MPSTATVPSVHGVFFKAWSEPPETNRHQLTHAVDAGMWMAWCGVATSAQGGTWPDDPARWDSGLGRCSMCARMVCRAAVPSS